MEVIIPTILVYENGMEYPVTEIAHWGDDENLFHVHSGNMAYGCGETLGEALSALVKDIRKKRTNQRGVSEMARKPRDLETLRWIQDKINEAMFDRESRLYSAMVSPGDSKMVVVSAIVSLIGKARVALEREQQDRKTRREG